MCNQKWEAVNSVGKGVILSLLISAAPQDFYPIILAIP